MGPKKKGAGRGSGGSAPTSEQENAPRPPARPQRILVGPYAPLVSPSDPSAQTRSTIDLSRTPRAYTPPLLGPQQGTTPAPHSDSGTGTPPPGFNVAPPQSQRPAGPRPAGPPRPAMRAPQAYNPLGPRPPAQAASPASAAPARPRPPQLSSAPNLRVMLPAEVTAVQGMGTLQLQEQSGAGSSAESLGTPRTTVQPTTGKDITPALRPGFGTLGRPIRLKANFFKAVCSKETIFHYDVVISPDIDKTGVRRAVIRELVRTHRSTTLANALPVFDGSKSLYTARPLPFHSREFTEVTPPDEVPLPPPPPGQPAREPRRFKVMLSIVANIDMDALQRFLQARTLELPQTSIQALDIVMREKALLSNVPVGRSFFNENVDRPVNLSGGLVAWRGYYQSMRPTQGGLMLNLDMSASAFHKPINVVDYIPEVVPRWSGSTLGDADRVKLGKALVGVRFEVTHRGEMRRRHRIMGITRKAARDLKFLYNGEEISVEGYFLQAYNYRLRHPGLQCFEVGAKKDVLIPMEVCRIVGGQRYPRKLSDSQVLELLRIVQQKPAERKRLTENMVARNDYGRDEYAREFGLTISKDMSDVPGRVLNPPTVVYKEMNQRDKLYQPKDGAWNLRSTCLYSGVNIDRWAVLSFVSRRMQGAVANFASRLASKCNEMGMNMNPATLLPVEDWLVGDNAFSSPREMTAALKAVTSQAHRADPQGLQLLICVFPSKEAQPYGTLKRVCETEIGLVTQCCLARHVQKSDPQYLANVVLKINVKVKAGDGERPAINNLLSKELQGKLPFINEDNVPTIIFGADVTHPQPGERDEGTSVAAIVASQDWPYVNRYEALVSAQPGTEEIIQNAEGMFKDHLIAFYRKTGQKPQRIIMYRDGVSEGQFYQVLLHELRALWKTCAKLEPDYKPKVTWIVCQKRHKTRLYCADERQADRSGNIPAGTVVDRVITHPSQFDFYLNSHTGLKGTSRPCHYHVLYDQNGFTADAIQDLTNSLCYTFARCTRSVSLAPPAYYAHLAAFRARFYMDSAENDRGSVSSGSSGRREAGRAPYRLPAIKEALHGTMFFC